MTDRELPSQKSISKDPEVLYENEDFLAINKPAGLLVHGAAVTAGRKTREPEPTLVDWLRLHRPMVAGVGDEPGTRPGIVHRLDKETSGVILVAKTQDAFNFLKGLFQEHRIRKTYLALVYGRPKEASGVIDRPIGILSGTTRRSIHSGKMAKEAVTAYRLVSSRMVAGQERSLLEVSPKTGRTHQIRVHLASSGYPIVGDRLYAKGRPAGERLFLHALAVDFSPKPGEHLRIEAPLPEEFRPFLADPSKADLST